MRITDGRFSFSQAIIFCSILLTLILASASFAQVPPEIKAIQDKMARGEKLTETEQKAFDDYMQKLNDRINNVIKKGQQIGKKPVDPSKPVKLDEDDYLPKFDASAHYNNAPVPTQNEYLALVRKYNEQSGIQLAESKAKLNQSFAQMKTASEISNVGMASLFGGKKDVDNSTAALFAATTAALKAPDDALIASNIGVLLKNAGAYQDSLIALLYAQKLAPQSATIQVNLGWTIAYLGDFFTAKMHFQSAINFDKFNYQGYEGLGLLYRVEGNAPEASKYLRMCLKQGFSRPAARNLSLIENKYDILIIASDDDSTDPDSTPGMKLSEIFEFPYPAPLGADDQVTFADAPEFYSSSVKKVFAAHKKVLFNKYGQEKTQELQQKFQQLQELQNTLDPINPEPVYDGNTVIYPRSYEAEVYALMDMEAVFTRRHLFRAGKFRKKIATEITQPAKDKFYALQKKHTEEHNGCNRDEQCQETAMRNFCRAKMNMLLTYNPSFQASWVKFLNDERADLRKYYKLAAPWLAEIGDPKLNKYLNLRREIIIQFFDPLESDSVWQEWEGTLATNYSETCDPAPPEPDSTPIGIHGNKLKIFPNPYAACHVPTWKIGLGAGAFSFSSEATCDSIKLEMSAADAYLGFDTKFADNPKNDVTTFHFGGSFKEGVDSGALSVNAGVKAGAYISVRNGEVIDKGFEGSLKSDWRAGEKGDGFGQGFGKTEIGKLGTTNISLGSGPLDIGKPVIDFQGTLPDAIRDIKNNMK